jgi:hypothetical protein
MDVTMMMMTGENLVGESDKQTDDFGSNGPNAKNSNSPLEKEEKEEQLVTSTLKEQEQETTSLTAQLPIDWRLLPPLLAPRDDKRNEFRRGAGTLGGSTIICIILVHGGFSIWSGQIQRNTFTWWVFIISVYVVGILQLFFLFAMYYVNPGVVKRSSVTCFPIPSQAEPYIRSYLQQQQQLQPQPQQSSNPQQMQLLLVPPPVELYIQSEEAEEADDSHGETGDIYCVRCLVWRRGKKQYFHCATCQRCVANYDHHCGVFGRCIAGKLPCQGNLPFFFLIIITGGLLFWLTVIALAWMFGSSSF